MTSERLLRSYTIDEKGKEHTYMFACEGWAIADSCGPNLSPMTLLHIETEAGADFTFDLPEQFNTLCYVQEGTVSINEETVNQKHSVIFERQGSTIHVTSEAPARFIVLAGKPLNEPVVTYGPFVGSTADDIVEAIQLSQAGQMGDVIE